MQLNFLAVIFTVEEMIECKNSTFHFYKCHDVFLCTSVGDPHDKTGVKKIVGWTFGSVGVVLNIVVIIAIVLKRRVMRRRQNDEQEPILGGVVDEIRNNLQASGSGGSEVASGSESVRPSSSKKDNINRTLKNM